MLKSNGKWLVVVLIENGSDLVSFDPDISDALQLFITRVFRDEEFIKQAEEEVMAFNDEIDIIVQQLKGKENGS